MYETEIGHIFKGTEQRF